MLMTSAEAHNRVCLMDLVGRDNVVCAVHCMGEECSAWRWEAANDSAAAAERLGHCGLVGRVERTVRKRPRRTVEATVTLSCTGADPRRAGISGEEPGTVPGTPASPRVS